MTRDSRGTRIAIFEAHDSRFFWRKNRKKGAPRIAVFLSRESLERRRVTRQEGGA